MNERTEISRAANGGQAAGPITFLSTPRRRTLTLAIIIIIIIITSEDRVDR